MSLINPENFFVVVYTDDSVQIIPTIWLIEGEIRSYWPTCKSYLRYYKFVESCKEPEANRDVYMKKVLYYTGNFEKGMVKLKKAEETSELSSDMHSEIIKKRTRKIRAQRTFDECDEIMIHRQKNKHNSEEVETLEFPPVSKFSIFTHSEEASSSYSFPSNLNQNADAPMKENIDVSTISEQTTGKAGCGALKDVNCNHLMLSKLKDLNKKVLLIHVNQQILIERISTIEQNLVNMSLSYSSKSDELEMNNLWRAFFLITSMKELEDVELELQDENKLKAIIKKAQVYASKDVKATVTNLLKEMLINSVASNYSFFGAKGKKIFGNLQIVKIIEAVVRRQKNVELCTNEEIHTHIKNWLRLSTLRLERESKPNKLE